MANIVILLIGLVLLAPMAAQAEAEFKSNGFVSSTAGYNTNQFLKDESSGTIGMSTGLTITRETEDSSLSTSSSLGGTYYTSEDKLRYDVDVGKLGSNYDYRINDRLTSNSALSLSLMDAFNFNVQQSGVTTRSDSNAFQTTVSQGFTYALDPLSSMALSYSFHPVLYQDDSFADSYNHNVTLAYNRVLTEKLTGSLSLGYAHTSYSDASAKGVIYQHSYSPLLGQFNSPVSVPDLPYQLFARTENSISPTVGLTYQLTEHVSLNGNVGVTITNYTGGGYDIPTTYVTYLGSPLYLLGGTNRPDDTTTINYIGGLGVGYSGDRLTLALRYDRGVTQAVFNESVVTDGVTATAGYKLLERLSSTLGTFYRRSTTLTDSQDSIGTSVGGSTSLTYQLAEFWSTTLGYDYTHTEQGSAVNDLYRATVLKDDTAGRGGDSHNVTLSLTRTFNLPPW